MNETTRPPNGGSPRILTKKSNAPASTMKPMPPTSPKLKSRRINVAPSLPIVRMFERRPAQEFARTREIHEAFDFTAAVRHRIENQTAAEQPACAQHEADAEEGRRKAPHQPGVEIFDDDGRGKPDRQE